MTTPIGHSDGDRMINALHRFGALPVEPDAVALAVHGQVVDADLA
ncbi:hypothetical protein FHW79_006050 [Azospirillum sp. OGB3]|nr:hypothetical protein [Azospirillum sp. OGB3]MBB3268375.1 hypothetical protein [Azospirillum sp. OGB3]